MDELTYVCGDVEVRRTGRYALKTVSVGGKQLKLVEVTPVNDADGFWKKFVNEATLIVIQSEEDAKP